MATLKIPFNQLEVRMYLMGLSLFCLSSFAFAFAGQPVRLFFGSASKSAPVADYDIQVNNLKGKAIKFSDGKIFRLGEALGSGANSIIYEIADDPTKILRLESKKKSAGQFKYLRSTWKGYKTLHQYGVPVVRLFKSLPEEYIVAERVEPKIDFENFLRRQSGVVLPRDVWIEPSLFKKMEEAFLIFAGKIGFFSELGDFHSSQLVYDISGDRWVLLDWTDYHRFSVEKIGSSWQPLPGLTAMAEFFEGSRIAKVLQSPDGIVRCISLDPIYRDVATLCERAVQEAEFGRSSFLSERNGKGFRPVISKCMQRFLGLGSLLK